MTYCDICHGPTERILDCGAMPLANGYANPDITHPLSYDYCEACALWQIAERVAPETLFGDYAYASGNAGQWQQFVGLAVAWMQRAPKEGARIVDIGGNDGTLLSVFGGGINVDPFAPAQSYQVVRKPWGTDVIADIDAADLILATNVWAHLPDLHNATEAVAATLSLDGWFVVQAPWHRDLLAHNLFDTLYHEHAYVFGVQAMRALMQRHGLDVHDVEYLPNIHGGTLRYWIRHGNDGIMDSVARLTDIERFYPWFAQPQVAYDAWQHDEHARWRERGAGVFALGAPAKATMYWAMTDTARFVDRVFDDAPGKHGKHIPGTELVVEPFSAFPADTTAPVVAMAWNARRALTERVRALGYTGRVA